MTGTLLDRAMRVWWVTIFHGSKIHAEITLDLAGRELQHLPSQSRLHAYPEGVVQHIVGISQVTADTEVSSDHVRLARKVAGKQQARSDFMLIQVGQQVKPGHRAIFFQCN